MEKTTIRNNSNHSPEFGKSSYFLLQVVKSRYFFFLLGFILLIIISHNYNQNLNQKQNNNEVISSAGQYSNSSQGYAKSVNSIQEKVVDLALDQLGAPYVEAGKAPSTGFDCSGFTSYVFKKAGLEIPPSSITQSIFGETVDLNSAEKGDLIFFKSPTEGNNNIGHVGIIISTENDNVSFIHSSSSRGVVIDNLESKHYRSRFRSIRRVL